MGRDFHTRLHLRDLDLLVKFQQHLLDRSYDLAENLYFSKSFLVMSAPWLNPSRKLIFVSQKEQLIEVGQKTLCTDWGSRLSRSDFDRGEYL